MRSKVVERGTCCFRRCECGTKNENKGVYIHKRVYFFDKKIISETNTGVYILQECWRKWGKLRKRKGRLCELNYHYLWRKRRGKKIVIVGHINKKDECGNEDRGVYSLIFGIQRTNTNLGYPLIWSLIMVT